MSAASRAFTGGATGFFDGTTTQPGGTLSENPYVVFVYVSLASDPPFAAKPVGVLFDGSTLPVPGAGARCAGGVGAGAVWQKAPRLDARTRVVARLANHLKDNVMA